jgi:hypothetical protein
MKMKMALSSLAVFLATALFTKVWAVTIDLRTNAPALRPWLELGSVAVNDATWSTVSTQFSLGIPFTNPVIFTSLPDLGGELYTQGTATSTRIRNVVVDAGQVSFEVKVQHLIYSSPPPIPFQRLTVPSFSYCVS